MNNMKAISYKLKAKSCLGFTIIELIVSMIIFSMMTAVVLANYPAFRQKIFLKTKAQEIALTIRQAQAYALGVKWFGGVFPGYGVKFSQTPTNIFVFFADINNNGTGNNLYDGSSELVQQINLGNQVLIDSPNGGITPALCGDDGIAAPAGDNFNGCKSIDTLYAIYKRPVPTVRLAKDGTGSGTQFQEAHIVIKNQEGQFKTIVIRMTGQISIE